MSPYFRIALGVIVILVATGLAVATMAAVTMHTLERAVQS